MATNPKRRQWEYTRAGYPALPSSITLNNLGEAGWELVQIVHDPKEDAFFAYLKREVADE